MGILQQVKLFFSFIFEEKKEKLDCSHNVMICPHNIITCQHNVTTCPHNVITCPHNIITCPHNIITCQHNVIPCPHNVITSPHNIIICPHNVNVFRYYKAVLALHTLPSRKVRLGYCFTPIQRLWLYNGAPLVAFYDTLGIRRTYS